VLLHSRLRILDVSERADQPMLSNQKDRVVMVFNGEVYNYRSLREELSKAGLSFRTSSDAEVLLAAFSTWGIDAFRRARGMWAVAFWEASARRLTLARDPLGKKPLVYLPRNDRVAFASNVSALLALLDQTPAIDQTALDCYLAHLCVPQEHAMFVGMRKVPPGAVVTWCPTTGVTTEHYWSLSAQPRTDLDEHDIGSEIERLLRQAVRRRLESDVPLGTFLSAGYDSGLVTAFASQESARPLVAVTAGTTGSGYDEREPAALVARRYSLDHRPLEVEHLSAASLPMLIAELGEPFGDSSLLPSFEVARAARKEITVALTGDGGDEGFFGYETFRGVWLAERYRRVVPRSVRDWLWRGNHSHTSNGWRRGLEAVLEYGRVPLAQAFRNRMGFRADERERLLVANQELTHSAEHIFSDRLRRFALLPDADALRRTLFETYLPNDYLTKVDTATMAAALEARCPFLDLDLVEFLLTLPEDVVFPRGRLKALLRPIARRHLPAEIIGRRKSGFGVPVARWMRGPVRSAFEYFVLRRGGPLEALISTREARRFAVEHDRGADHSTRLWGLLALGVWFAVVVDRSWVASAPLPIDGGRP
jgi:asparagine synthase (glutamine-hydrolysing)